MRREHRGRRLLDLEEEGVLAVGAGRVLEQDDEGAGADAADTDDLEADVDEPVPLEQGAPVILQGAAIGPKGALHGDRDVVGQLDTGEEGRLVDDPVPAVHLLGQLRERLQVILRPRLGEARLRTRAELGGEPVEHRLDVEPRVPHVERVHLGEARDRVPVRLDRVEDGLARLLRLEPAVPARNGKARREPLDVPFPGSRERLVEVVDVEDDVALGRREDAEVREVAITAGLNVDPGRGRRGEVAGHDDRGAAQERERRRDHPPVPDRQEVRKPRR